MPNHNKRVMLVDDNEIDLKINAKFISLSGLSEEIIVCNSGDEALAYLNKYLHDPTKLPQLILLDIQMPEMDGFEFLEQYKAFSKSLTDGCAVIMLSSTLDFGDIQRAEANPYVVKLLRKPLSIKELGELI